MQYNLSIVYFSGPIFSIARWPLWYVSCCVVCLPQLTLILQAFVLLSLYGEWWMPFMMLVMVFVYQYIAVGVFFQQTKGLLEHSADESTDSEV